MLILTGMTGPVTTLRRVNKWFAANALRLIISSLKYPKLTDEALEMLPCLTDLYLHSIGGRRITTTGLRSCRGLKYLNLNYNDRITTLPPTLTTLTILKISGNELITNDHLRGLTSLTFLDLSNNERITDVGLKHCAGITKLYLGNNKMITAAGLAHLPLLENLDLSEQETVTSLENCSVIKKLCLRHNKGIDDAKLLRCPGLSSLTELDLSAKSLITEAALDHCTSLVRLRLGSNRAVVVDPAKYPRLIAREGAGGDICLQNSNFELNNICLSMFTARTGEWGDAGSRRSAGLAIYMSHVNHMNHINQGCFNIRGDLETYGDDDFDVVD